jgi:8-oxo-dGTP pyrophosphatase MutT (NUDIX family)
MDIIKQLENYQPKSSEEINFKNHILDFARNYENIFSRDQLYGHFTASAFVVNSDMSKFLLIHHKKIGIWMQVGGHCDGDENVLNVAIKEASEESGIPNLVAVSDDIFDIDTHKIPKFKDIPEHYHFDVRFLLRASSDELILNEEEVNHVKWVGFDDDLSEYNLGESILRMIEKFKLTNKTGEFAL